MAKKIFKNKAMKKLSAPDQLGSLIQVIPNYAWVGMLSLILLLMGFIFYVFFGKMTSKVEASCLFYPANQPTAAEHSLDQSPENLAVYLFVNDLDANKIAPNMKVLISAQSDVLTQYGYLLGQVEEVTASFLSDSDSSQGNGDDRMEQLILNPRFKVKINPLRDEKTGYFKTSTQRLYPGPIMSKSICHAAIILKEQAPIRYIFPHLLDH